MMISETTVQKIGLQVIKTLVVLMIFFGASFILNTSAASSLQKAAAQSLKADEMLKALDI